MLRQQESERVVIGIVSLSADTPEVSGQTSALDRHGELLSTAAHRAQHNPG